MKNLSIPTDEQLKKISSLLKENRGDDTLEIKIPNENESKSIILPYTINFSSKLMDKIFQLLGG